MSNGNLTAKARLLAYLQLVRIPNVFTAIADVAMGFLVVHQSLEPYPVFLLLVAATGCLYSAGMVLNDVYDYAKDQQERPHRPLPSGRIQVASARTLGYTLLGLGILLGGLAGIVATGTTDSWWRGGLIAGLLATCVLLYDVTLKETLAGPWAMGACRGLNVLLGMSVGVSGGTWLGYDAPHLTIAAGIGTYIVGVTWFARTEARESNRGRLAFGVGLMIAGALLLIAFPFTALEATRFYIEPVAVWMALLSLLMASVLFRCFRAIAAPQPKRVQLAVKHCILSLIFLDAAIVALVAPRTFALAVLALYLPTLLLGKWVYST